MQINEPVSISINRFQYNRNLRHERVNPFMPLVYLYTPVNIRTPQVSVGIESGHGHKWVNKFADTGLLIHLAHQRFYLPHIFSVI